MQTPFTRSADEGASQRHTLLGEIAEHYLETIVGVRPRFARGFGLPPADFINEELQRRGVSWRVQRVNGVRCEFRDA